MQSFLFLTLQFLLLLLIRLTESSISPDRFLRPQPPPSSSLSNSLKPQQFIELAKPLPSDKLTPSPPPSCILHVIHHSFADTIGGPPFSTAYNPPSAKCPLPWSHVALELRVASRGDQYDRISGLWLGGAEILRTSTAEPTSEGIFWRVRKDITRYTSLLVQTNLTLTMMLENIVNEVYTGVYHVDVFFLFYRSDAVTLPAGGQIRVLEEEGGAVTTTKDDSPADLVIPISSSEGYEKGFWFVVDGGESDVRSKEVRFPMNTRKAVLELYVSFHGNDEFWYSNPPNSYIRVNNLTTGRGNGAYREVFVTVDGEVVGSEVPFPVVFTGGINPLFWDPVVSIGAFNLPSYDYDLSPVLGLVLDGKPHTIGVGVSDGISYWLIDANLHIWLDGGSSKVEAKSVVYDFPATYITREEVFHLLDGSFEIKSKRRTVMTGWVKWSGGNHTTSVSQEFKFRSIISFEGNGTTKTVNQRIKVKKEVIITNEFDQLVSRVKIRRRYPFKMLSATLPGSNPDTYLAITNVSHGFFERDDDDDQLSCFVWSVSAVDGKLVKNVTSSACPSVYVN
ncbi:Peptide-N4-(N-acetyl-beta-glucosaminyl)asparagineamidase A [Linum grandiflorum]